MAAMSSEPTPRANAGDISALAVWIACAALFAVLTAIGLTAPDILQGHALHPVTGEPNWEWGLLEQLQNITLAASLVLALFLLTRAEDNWMRIWLVLIALGSLFLLGEETSWGQHYFRWGTDGWFAEMNDQAETNLHNTSYWLDQAPRSLLQVGIVVGGLIHPLLKLVRKGKGLIDKPWWLAPTIVCVPVAIFMFLAGAPKAIDKLEILPFSLQFTRTSEMEENFIYGFFIVYLLSLGARLRFRRQQRG